MTFQGAAQATPLDGTAAKMETQTIGRGPVAALVAIKQLGTNGGGFFGPNSTHPFENPSPWSNLLAIASIVMLPMASIVMAGHMLKDMRHAAVIYGVMLALLVAGGDRRRLGRDPAQRRHGRAAGGTGPEHGGQGGPARPGRRRRPGRR